MIAILIGTVGYFAHGVVANWQDTAKDLFTRLALVVVGVGVVVVAMGYLAAEQGVLRRGGLAESALGTIERMTLGILSFFGALLAPLLRLVGAVL